MEMVGLKFISRKLRKGLDKSPNLWYNKYIKRARTSKKGNDTMEFFGCLGIFALFLAVWGLETWVIMALWNWLAVSLFGAPEITFWMTAGLMLLINLLTGGIKISCNHK